MGERVGPSWPQLRRTLGLLTGNLRRIAADQYPDDDKAQDAFLHGAFEGYLLGLRETGRPPE